MKMKDFKSRIVEIFKSIGVKNIFLILFVIILMSQTIYNLFENEVKGNSSAIDIVVRTTMAGLFGYIMGKGFAVKKHDITSNNKENEYKTYVPVEQFGENKQIDEEKNAKDTPEKPEKDYDFQIIIVGTLGILSLLILIVTRNLNVLTSENIATISQLRDIVSGSTGFLISGSDKT